MAKSDGVTGLRRRLVQPRKIRPIPSIGGGRASWPRQWWAGPARSSQPRRGLSIC